jgi:flavorubredoxin
MLEAAYLPKEATPTAVNEWLVNTGDKLVLVDTGTSNVFAPTLGRMAKKPRRRGRRSRRSRCDHHHAHPPDHAAGLLTTDKKVQFPNATIHVNADEVPVLDDW